MSSLNGCSAEALSLGIFAADGARNRSVRIRRAAQDGDARHILRQRAWRIALDPNQLLVFRARGVLAQGEGEMADAVAAYSRALAIAPGDGFSLGHRAEAYFAQGEFELALMDSAAALQSDRSVANLYLLRATIFRRRQDTAAAAAEASALITALPNDAYAHVAAAQIYRAIGRRDEAMRAVDQALTIAPSSYVYLNRALVRPRLDLDARRADFDTALRLDPNNTDTLGYRAELLQSQRDYEGAISDLTLALRARPDSRLLLSRRGVNYALAGRQALADADLAAAAGDRDNAYYLNNICWEKATAGVMLESALADCDAALALRPDMAGFLDSRALVLLRLGRVDEAIRDYDRALSFASYMPTSLYGRGLARLRNGDEEEARADMDAAANIDVDIGAQFQLYGLSPTSP